MFSTKCRHLLLNSKTILAFYRLILQQRGINRLVFLSIYGISSSSPFLFFKSLLQMAIIPSRIITHNAEWCSKGTCHINDWWGLLFCPNVGVCVRYIKYVCQLWHVWHAVIEWHVVTESVLVHAARMSPENDMFLRCQTFMNRFVPAAT